MSGIMEALDRIFREQARKISDQASVIEAQRKRIEEAEAELKRRIAAELAKPRVPEFPLPLDSRIGAREATQRPQTWRPTETDDVAERAPVGPNYAERRP
jgi:hypothetical protein